MTINSLAAGEIYFLGEHDPVTMERTPFVKIGIVRDRDNRSSESRRKEHQTGNPRLLTLDEVIKTALVERVETSLHWQFSPHRISGEWFYFPGEAKQAAIDAAKKLADDSKAAAIHIQNVEEFRKVLSTAEQITPDVTIWEIFTRLKALEAVVDECEEITKRITGIMVDVSKHHDLGALFTWQDKNQSDLFDSKSFKKDHPDLWNEFVDVSESLSGTFRLGKWPDGKVLPDLRPVELDSVVAVVKDAESKVIDGVEFVTELHTQFLRTLSLQGPIEWEIDVLEAELKARCGTAAEIVGVCKWPRAMKEKETLNKDALAEQHPEIFQQFVKVRGRIQVPIVSRDLGFRINH